MSNTNPSTQKKIDLKHLISGPLVATIEAEKIAIDKYLQTLSNFAFDSYDAESGEFEGLRTLTFTYLQNEDILTGEKKYAKLKIPIVSLFPIPILQIEEADFNIDVRLLDVVFPETSAECQSLDNDESRFHVTVEPTSELKLDDVSNCQQEANPNLKISVKIRQGTAPAGLNKFLDICSNTLNVTQVPTLSTEKTKEND